MTALEKVVYIAGAMVACVAGLSPDGIWIFPVPGVPAWTFPLFVLLALCAALLTHRTGDGAIVPSSRDNEPSDGTRWRMRIVVFLVALGVLWFLRCRTTYGDARAIVGFIHDGVLFHKREPLSPTLFLLVHRALGEALGWTPELTIQIVNTIAGAVGVVVVVGIARRIAGPSRDHRIAATAVILGSGAVQLFAGYVENYTLPTVCMLGSIACALDAFAGRRDAAWSFALWTLACMFHLAGLVFAPAMAWLLWNQRARFRVAALATTGRLLAVTVLPSIVLYVLMARFGFLRAEERGFGGGDGLMFVPLFDRTGLSQYLLFRPAHLVAIANQQLLVAPLGIVMVATGTIAAWWRVHRGEWRDDGARPFAAQLFLVIVSLAFFGLTMIWNPDLGPLRDWDLFGPVGFYLNICGVALICHHLREQPKRSSTLLVFIAVVNLSRALPFVLHNASP